MQAQTSPTACTESSAGLARSFLGQSFQLSFNCICRVSDVPHRFRKPFLRYIEFVGPILNFMGLEKADSASILRTPVGEIIWHTFSPLEATRWRVGQFQCLSLVTRHVHSRPLLPESARRPSKCNVWLSAMSRHRKVPTWIIWLESSQWFRQGANILDE